MRRKPPIRDPIASHKRKVTATLRVGKDAQCACGESRAEALIEGSVPITCGECDRSARGKSTSDNHHPAGDANDPATIPVPVNDHRADLSVAQYDWPRSTLENPKSSPLIAQAARIRGYVDTNAYLIEKLVAPDADLLETLDQFLTKKLGPDWWLGTELERFKPKR
jgi:hypothetical protein